MCHISGWTCPGWQSGRAVCLVAGPLRSSGNCWKTSCLAPLAATSVWTDPGCSGARRPGTWSVPQNPRRLCKQEQVVGVSAVTSFAPGCSVNKESTLKCPANKNSWCHCIYPRMLCEQRFNPRMPCEQAQLVPFNFHLGWIKYTVVAVNVYTQRSSVNEQSAPKYHVNKFYFIYTPPPPHPTPSHAGSREWEWPGLNITDAL